MKRCEQSDEEQQNKYCRDDVGPGDRDVSNKTSSSWGIILLLCETLALCFSEHEKRSSADNSATQQWRFTVMFEHNISFSHSCWGFLKSLWLFCPSAVSSLPQPSTLSLKARHTTAFWWPLYSLLISPVSTHHRRARLSEDAVGSEPESVVRNVYVFLSNSLKGMAGAKI